MAEQSKHQEEETIVTTNFGDLHISHADAQIPERYRSVKAEAERLGRRFVIDAAPAAAPRAVVPGEVLIPKDASVETYRRMKADAEKRGVSYRVAD